MLEPHIGESIENSVKRLLEARDKWWIEKMEQLFNGYKHPTCVKCDKGNSCYADTEKCPLWQSIKKEVSNGK